MGGSDGHEEEGKEEEGGRMEVREREGGWLEGREGGGEGGKVIEDKREDK